MKSGGDEDSQKEEWPEEDWSNQDWPTEEQLFAMGKSGKAGKGKGCFTCGSPHHFARDCPKGKGKGKSYASVVSKGGKGKK